MPQDDFKPKLGRMRDARGARLLKHTTRVFRQAGKAGVRALRQKDTWRRPLSSAAWAPVSGPPPG